MRNARLFVVGLLVLFSARLVSSANAHTTDLNNRVTFYITAVAQTQVQGEAGLVLHAVLDNGTRNRITLRDLSSTAGSKVVLYGISWFNRFMIIRTTGDIVVVFVFIAIIINFIIIV